ncbi:hypothetical protein HAHE_41490 [Haloferula helveola]|uniref:Planctomycete cytochrome C n=1 Tax=Haloferula helveola TaxID=490095 RepID=A0ABM7RJU1_9BACT|nr:hypothetical protein HAHE_41490 [Haloferula helveola]
MKPALVILAGALPLSAPAEELTSEETKFFEQKIRPVLAKYCYECHAEGEKIKGGLRVDYRDGLIHGGDSGPAVVPGDPTKSLIYTAMAYQDPDYEMPPKKKLPDEIIEDFRKWIEMGAPDPRVPDKVVVQSEIDIEEGKKHWSFQAPKASPAPQVEDAGWPVSFVDSHILSGLEKEGLRPASDAAPDVLLRRLHFDLTGLPPSYGQIMAFAEAWAKDPEAAYSAKVEELLASEHFGERWGRHWLDVARYAESTGKEVNTSFPYAWRYRDYVIDSFNEDKPYDRFVMEQIAGDLLPAKYDEDWQEGLIATGFLAMGPKSLNQQNPRQFEADLVDEQIDATSQAILGLTVSCARCHDHKSDPIPTEDYYSIAGIFHSTKTYFGTVNAVATRRATKLLELPVSTDEPQGDISPEEYQALAEQLEEQRNQLRELVRSGARQGNLQQQVIRIRTTSAFLEERLGSYNPDGTKKSFAMGVQDHARPEDATVLIRGELDMPAQRVDRGFLQLLDFCEDECPPDASGRLELAQWLTSEENPLTARVMANRIWSKLFGQGIVTSPDNFGVSGNTPTHPELLDALALEFVKGEWSVKSLIRELVHSRTYRMASTWNAEAYRKDPGNALLWRMPVRRLDAEALRDAMLFASGQLDSQRPLGSVIGEAGHVGIGRAFNTERLDSYQDYRSVYLPIVRDALPSSLALFDGADANIVTGAREETNIPSQALYLMNNDFVLTQAKSMATRLMEHTDDKDEWIRMSFLLCYGRVPNGYEVSAANGFFAQFRFGQDDDLSVLTTYCHSLLAAAEFRYLN